LGFEITAHCDNLAKLHLSKFSYLPAYLLLLHLFLAYLKCGQLFWSFSLLVDFWDLSKKEFLEAGCSIGCAAHKQCISAKRTTQY